MIAQKRSHKSGGRTLGDEAQDLLCEAHGVPFPWIIYHIIGQVLYLPQSTLFFIAVYDYFCDIIPDYVDFLDYAVQHLL
jgi:hypothetical protein